MAGPVLGLTGIGMATASMVDIRDVPELALLAIAVGAASVEFSRWVFRGVRYAVEDGTLVVRWRWGSRRIPLDTITGVDRIDYASSWALSDTLGNEYALGTDVLAIRCGDEVALNVSCPDEDAFFKRSDAVRYPRTVPRRLRQTLSHSRLEVTPLRQRPA